MRAATAASEAGGEGPLRAECIPRQRTSSLISRTNFLLERVALVGEAVGLGGAAHLSAEEAVEVADVVETAAFYDVLY